MTYTGHVQDGVVVFDTPVNLPEGTAVDIAVQAPGPDGKASAERPMTHFERYREFIGSVEGLPEDFAENHDHYIRGTPRR